MHRNVKAGMIAVAMAGGIIWTARTVSAAERSRAIEAAKADIADEGIRRDKDIAFYERRAAEDSIGASDRAMLATLYLQRSRQTGNYTDVLRAESLARRSIELRLAHNDYTYATLASALLSEHRFVEARAAAQQLIRLEPQEPSYRAMLGEIDLELGNYRDADSAFVSVRRGKTTLGSWPRLARWAELRGDTAVARRLFYGAMHAADSLDGLPREQAAWFRLRVGDFEMRLGHLDAAEHALLAGLAISPDDHRVLAALARLAWLRSEWRDAIAYGDRSVETALDPATLGIIGDAWAALGDHGKAEDYYRTMEVSVSQQPGAYHRAWSLFLLDHNRRVDDVVAAARTELESRRDVYGYDLLAWALYRQGRFAEADRMMAGALGRGTQDATLFYHAGAIARAAGDRGRARTWLGRAFSLNPRFDPVQAPIARRMLDSLETGG